MLRLDTCFHNLATWSKREGGRISDHTLLFKVKTEKPSNSCFGPRLGVSLRDKGKHYVV